MNLKKSYLYTEELAKEKVTVVWNSTFKKAKIYYLLMPFLGLILILAGMYSPNSQSYQTIIRPENNVQHITYFNLNLFLSFGIVLLFVSLFQFIGIFKHKNRIKRKLNLDLDKEKVLEMNSSHLISENNGIVYSIPLSRFHQKVEISNSILLFYDYEPTDFIQIDKRIFEKEELEQLNSYFNQHLT